MKTYTVIISAAAEADLLAILDYISERAGERIARGFVDRIETYCIGFSTAPERGTGRDDLRPGLRTVGFRRQATILFEVDHQSRRVVIHGVYYGGRSFDRLSIEDDPADETD
jgi:toxin ParE1/3/4